MCLKTGRPTTSGGIKRGMTSGEREVIDSLCSALMRQSGLLSPCLGPPVQERCGAVGTGPEEAMKMTKGLEHHSYEET